MRSPQNLFLFVPFRILRHSLLFTASGFRIFNSAGTVRPFVVAIAVMFSFSSKGDIPITDYLVPEPVGPCLLACECDGNFDSVVWTNWRSMLVAVSRPDCMPFDTTTITAQDC